MWNDDHGKIQLVIDELRETLVLKVKYDKIQLAVRRFISEMSADRIEAEKKSSQDRMMSLLSEVSSCSQEDFDQFLVVVAQSYRCFEETIQRAYFKGFGCHLDVPRINIPLRVRGDPAHVEETQEPFLNVSVRHQVPATATAASRDAYEMNSHPHRGLCLIINNKHFQTPSQRRDGSERDLERMKNFFFDFLGFKVTTETDLTAQEMRDCLKAHAENAGLDCYSALAVVLMSHGEEGDYIYGTDFNAIGRIELMQFFTTSKCPAMRGKPKLFIVQACRGDFEDIRQSASMPQEPSNLRGSPELQLEGGPYQSDNIHVSAPADMCFVFASSAGYRAYRSAHTGSLFVEEYIQFMEAHAEQKMYPEIIQMIMSKFSEAEPFNVDSQAVKTVPEYWTTLTKNLYLQPRPQARAAAPRVTQ